MKLKKYGWWEVSVKDETGRVQTFTYLVWDRREALEEFIDRSGWSRRKLRQRLVRCSPVVTENISCD